MITSAKFELTRLIQYELEAQVMFLLLHITWMEGWRNSGGNDYLASGMEEVKDIWPQAV